MGQKLFGRIKDRMHRVKGREPQEGDKFSFRMARFIIHKKGWIESVFVAGCVFSLIAMLFVNVNYDLTEYLPASARSLKIASSAAMMTLSVGVKTASTLSATREEAAVITSSLVFAVCSV